MASNHGRVRYADAMTIFRTAMFRLGFEDARKGKPLRDLRTDNRNEHWSYERGRLFAVLNPDLTTLKVNRRPCPVARMRFFDAVRNKDLI